MNIKAKELVDLQFSKWMDKTLSARRKQMKQNQDDFVVGDDVFEDAYEEENIEDENYPSGQEDYTDLS